MAQPYHPFVMAVILEPTVTGQSTFVVRPETGVPFQANDVVDITDPKKPGSTYLDPRSRDVGLVRSVYDGTIEVMTLGLPFRRHKRGAQIRVLSRAWNGDA